MIRRVLFKPKVLSLIFSFGLLGSLSLLLLMKGPVSAQKMEAPPNSSPRELVHLLDYLSQDYSGAVANGKVISVSEYQEQMEFSEMATQIGHNLSELKTRTDIVSGLDGLQELIHEKAAASAVATLAQKLKEQVIKTTGLPVAPNHWPSLAHGRELYSQACVSCHGMNGDGKTPLAEALNPKPANFLDPERMNSLSPFKAFNAVRIGVPKTAMVAQSQLSDKDIWDLAYYVVSLRHQAQVPGDRDEAKEIFTSLSKDFDLEKISVMSDHELESKIPESQRAKGLAVLRTHSGDDDSHDSLQLAHIFLTEAEDAYNSGKVTEAKSKALMAYLEGVEPVEPRLRATNPVLTSDLEGKMADVRTAIEKQRSTDVVRTTFQTARLKLKEAGQLLEEGPPSPWLTFLIASAILLREGFEAVLIIIALLGVVRASGSKTAANWIHGGWISALSLGALTWFVSGVLMNMSGAQRELMEGFTSILAVLILLYMGFWLHRTTEIGRWTKFINEKVRTALEGKKLFGLAAISFMAVFREAFETVLFLRALWLEGGMSAKWAMLGGVIGALLLILLLAWAILRYTARIPIRKLFDFSSTLMTVLSVILIGKGLHSLQETGLVGISPSPLNLKSDLFGFYPTLETSVSQILILIIALSLWIWGKKPSLMPKH